MPPHVSERKNQFIEVECWVTSMTYGQTWKDCSTHQWRYCMYLSREILVQYHNYTYYFLNLSTLFWHTPTWTSPSIIISIVLFLHCQCCTWRCKNNQYAKYWKIRKNRFIFCRGNIMQFILSWMPRFRAKDPIHWGWVTFEHANLKGFSWSE